MPLIDTACNEPQAPAGPRHRTPAMQMARQPIVCCDRTGNNLTGRLKDANVTELFELLAPDTKDHFGCYGLGVDNPGELPGATFADRLSDSVERICGWVFGEDSHENLSDGDNFMTQNDSPGTELLCAASRALR